MRATAIFLVFVAALGIFLFPSAATAQDSFAGVWRSGNDAHYLWAGVDWNSFNAKWEELSKQNLRLVDVATYGEGSQRKYVGVWRGGSDAHFLWAGVDWNNFNAQWQELAKQNLRLTILRTYVEGGQRKYIGVWRAGSDAHFLWAGVDWNSFNAKWEELSKQGLRLVDMETYTEGNSRKYIGVWRAGNDAHYLWAGVDWNSFNAKWQELGKQGLRLTVFKTYMEGNQRKYAGVWRAGSDGFYLWAGVDFENFKSKWHELAGQNLRLVSIATYEGCGGECANKVVATSAYNYNITGHNTTYHWPVDEAGGDKYVRLSALTFSAAPFTLPFSDSSVTRQNGWLYQPSATNPLPYHHAVDYANDLVKSFQIRAAAPGKVIFIGWDNWSGNTIVISHDVGGVQDAFRTIYMHMRNGPANDCAKAWTQSVPPLSGSTLNGYEVHLNGSGCPKAPANQHPNPTNWGTNDQTIAVAVNQQVAAGHILGWAGDTGPGGNGTGSAKANTHLHIFFTRRDPTDNQFYFFDPYGIYGFPNCYPSGNTAAITTVCARYPNAWKGGHPQYP